METTTYKPHSGRLGMRRIIGGAFALFGGGMGCLFFLGGILILLLMLGSETAPQEALPVTLLFACGGPGLGVVFAVIGAIVGFSGGNEQVQLTAEALAYTQGKTTTTLYLSEIAHLEGKWRPGTRAGTGHWALVITDQYGDAIELDIPQGAYLATFDVAPILRDLLSRLPATAQIEPRVQNYVTTGRMRR
jgi:hypothetical protein